MKCVQSSENGPGGAAKELAECNEAKQGEKKEVKSGVVGVEGQRRSVGNGLRGTEVSKDANIRPTSNMVHPVVDAHRAQPQPQGQVVCWERFLPVRSLKVLLVESDDSTRHVVNALLRNCSYDVTAVSNGIEAWKILENLENQIDLVLTEVVMSGLSGIGLLSKIMTHKSCRNIPVIMMSSYDSMGIVLKCLSRGAADFLVKPIRKNELKNLWQHVWRRCHSSSGSGSESAVGNEKSVTTKRPQESENDTASNNADDSRSSGLQARGGSDNGSGTQSSWTKRAAEVDSPRPLSLCDQPADPPDSTCGQVNYQRSEAFASSWEPASMQEFGGHDNVSMGKDLEIGLLRNMEPQKGPSKKVSVTNTEEKPSSHIDLNLKNDGEDLDKKLEISKDQVNGVKTREVVKVPGDIVRSDGHCGGSTGSGTPAITPEIPRNNDKLDENVQELPSLELSLNRLGDGAQGSINVSEQNILRHSELSAFTRYNTGSTANQGLTGNVGSCSPADNSSEAAKQPNSHSTPNQNSNSSSNNNDMGSTTHKCFTKPAAATDKLHVNPILNCSQQTSSFQPARKGPASDPQVVASSKANPELVNVKPQPIDMCSQAEIQHQRQYYDHHSVHKHVAHDEFSIKTMSGIPAESGSSNSRRLLAGPDAVNCSLNRSACGSNHGSNVHIVSSGAVNAEEMNIVNDGGVAAKDGTDNGSGSGSGSGSGVGVDQNRSAQREAALNKFRLKRKERCFEKKVRYQSRKKLAEQRPRIRGQFVRQMQDNKGEDADS